MVLNGVDVSNHQRDIDWDAVAADNIQFAFIKATEGINFKDVWFERNWTEAKRVGLVRGAYHFARPHLNDAVSEAYYFLDYVKYATLEPHDILILDMEDEKFHGDVIPWTVFFCEVIESIVGFNPIIYTGPWYIQSRMQNYAGTKLGEYPLWLAAYNERPPITPKPWTQYKLWQYTSKGRVNGINGDADKNTFFGTIEELKAFGKPDIVKPPAPVVDVEALKQDISNLEQSLDDLTNTFNIHTSLIRAAILDMRKKLST